LIFCTGEPCPKQKNIVYYNIRKADKSDLVIVELSESNRELSLDEFMSRTIIIPNYVKIIDSGVFVGLMDVVTKSSYRTNHASWEDGWIGDCEVEWGSELSLII
jgi:hypothetical protein